MPSRQTGAMRSVFWLLALACLAVALALLMGNNSSTVTLFWPPYRYDVSFNFFLFALLGCFVVLYAAMRALSVLRELPVQAQRWRQQQVERAAVGFVMDALSHQLAGRFVRAQAAAQNALDQLQGASAWPRREQLQLLAHLMLAESAQSLQNRERRDRHLQLALAPELARKAPETAEGVMLRAVHWAVEDRDVETARSRLAELPQGMARRIQALRLKLRVAGLGDATQEALETARLLAKHRAFSPEASRSIVRGLAMDALREAQDLSQLRAVWNSLDASERAMPDIVLVAAAQAQRQAAADADEVTGEEARQWVRTCVEPLWTGFNGLSAVQQLQFVRVYEPCLAGLDGAGLARLEQLQRLAPQNACLQYLAGQACMHRQLWGKAAQLLGQARHGLHDATLLRRTWRSLALLAEERGDAAAAQAAWRTAAQLD